MSSSLGGSTFTHDSFDNNTDLVQQKKTSLLDKVIQKRSDLGFSTANLTGRNVEALDADTVRINPSVADKAFDPMVKPVDVRLKSNNFGESFNSYEVKHGNEDDPKVAARLSKQRDTIDNELTHGWFNPATNQDVYDRGNKAKQILADKLKAVNEGKTGLDFALGERDMYGRELGDMKFSNEDTSAIDSMNTPELNSSYDTPFNFAKQNKDTATFGQAVEDTGRLALTGFEGIGSALGYGLEKSGIAPELGRQIQDEHFKHDKMLRNNLSDPVKQASEQPLLDENNDLNPNFGWTSLATNVIPSIPGSLVMGGAGGVLAKGLGLGAKAVLGAEGTASKLITNGLGYGTSEGVFSAAQNADQWGQEQRLKPVDEFKKSPVWNEILAQNNGDEEATKEAIINQGQSDIFQDTAIKTGALSGLPGIAGGMYGELFKSAGTKITAKQALINSLKGMGEEAAQEYPQSLFERRTTNQATKDYIDPNQDVSEGQWNDAAVGGLSGFAMGAMGAGGHIASIDRTKTPTDTQTPTEENIVQPETNLEPSKAILDRYSNDANTATIDTAESILNQGIKDFPYDAQLSDKKAVLAHLQTIKDKTSTESVELAELTKKINLEEGFQSLFPKGTDTKAVKDNLYHDGDISKPIKIEELDDLLTGLVGTDKVGTTLFNNIGRTKDKKTLEILHGISKAKETEYADSTTVNDPYVLAVSGIETKNLPKESSKVFSGIMRGDYKDLNQGLLLLSSHVEDIKGTEEQKNTGISVLTKTISKVYSDKVDITSATERTVKQALNTINGLVTNKGTITIEPSDSLEKIYNKILPTFGSQPIEINGNEKANGLIALNNATKENTDKLNAANKLNDKTIPEVNEEIISGGGEKFSAKDHLTVIATMLINDLPKDIINTQVAKFKVWADFHKAKGTLALELANAPESKRAEIELRLKELQKQDGFKGFKYQSIIYPTSGTPETNQRGITKLAQQISDEAQFLQTMADEAQRTLDNWGSINAEPIQEKLRQEQKLLDSGKSSGKPKANSKVKSAAKEIQQAKSIRNSNLTKLVNRILNDVIRTEEFLKTFQDTGKKTVRDITEEVEEFKAKQVSSTYDELNPPLDTYDDVGFDSEEDYSSSEPTEATSTTVESSTSNEITKPKEVITTEDKPPVIEDTTPTKQEFTPEYQKEITNFNLVNKKNLKPSFVVFKNKVKQSLTNPIFEMLKFDNTKNSLYGKYPKLFKNLFNLPEFSLQTKDGLEAFKTLQKEETKFQKIFNESYREGTFNDDPLVALANRNVSNGKFDPNIVSAMFMGSIDWLMNKGSDTLFNFEKDIQSILSMDENIIPQNEISNTLSELGSIRAMVATGLGNNIFNLMKFTASKTYPENEIAKLKLSLGLHALNTLNNMGYVTYSAIENSTFDKFKQNEVINSGVKGNLRPNELQDQSVVFVRIASDIEDKKSVIENDLKQVLDTLKAGSKEITAMFESAYEKELPRTKKPNKASILASLGFNEDKGKKASGLHTTQEITSERIDALTEYVQTPHTLDTPTMKLLLAMDKDAMAEMELGVDFQEQKQQSKERSYRGKVLSYEKEKEALDKLLELSEQGSKPLYFMSTFWNQGRIGGIGVGHPQNNKWIRNLSSPKNYFVKIKPNDEFAVTQFKLAVLEAFGVAAKSLTKEQIDPKFQEILEANQKAIDEINKQKEGKEFNSREIINAVHKSKEKAHTLNGLVALSMYSATEEFETNIGREVDGITNGVLIGLVLLAGVENFERMKDVLAAAGLFEDPIMDYATWKNSVESKEDNYEQIARVFAESLNQAEQTPQLLAIKHFIGELLVDDKVTKPGRNFAKPILLLTMFGKSTDKLANSVGDTVIATFYDELEKLFRDTELQPEEKEAKLEILKTQIQTILGKEKLQGNWYVDGKVVKEDNKASLVDLTMNNLLEFSLTQQDANSIIATVNHLFQPMIEEAINHNFGVTIANRKILNDAYFVVGEVFKLGLQKELLRFQYEQYIKVHPDNLHPTRKQLEHFRANEGKEPSAEQLDKIIADLIKIQPRSPTKNSESLEQDLQLWNSERSSNHTAAYKTQTGWNSKTGELTYQIADENGRIFTQVLPLPKSTSAHALSLIINSLGVGVTIANIHNRDSNVMIDMMKSKFKGLAVHDAFIFNLLEAVEGSKLLNSSLIDSLNSFDVFQGAIDNLERVQEYLKANPDIANELNASFINADRGLFVRQRFYEPANRDNPEITPHYNNLDNFVERLKANQEILATQRQEQIWDHIPKGGVKQYGGQDSNVFEEDIKPIVTTSTTSIKTEELSTTNTNAEYSGTKEFTHNGVTITTDFPLGEEQSIALHNLIDFVEDPSKKNIERTLIGSAGTGKTSIIGYLQKYFQTKEGKDVNTRFVYAAPTHAATAQLAFATIKTGNTTLPSTVKSSIKEVGRYPSKFWVFSGKIFDKKDHGELNNIFVIDESSMLDPEDIKHIQEAAKISNAVKVIYMGDDKQLSAVQSNKKKAVNKPVSPVFDFGKTKTDRLTKVHRQGKNTLLDILTAIRNETSFKVFKPKDNTENVEFVSSRDKLINNLLDALNKDPTSAVAISYTNRVVNYINTKVREKLNKGKFTSVGETVIGYAGYSGKQIHNQQIANSISYAINEIKDLGKGNGVLLNVSSKQLGSLSKLGMDKVKASASGKYLQLSNTDALQFENQDLKANNETLASLFNQLLPFVNKSYGDISKEEREEVGQIIQQINSYELGDDYVFSPRENKMVLYNKTEKEKNYYRFIDSKYSKQYIDKILKEHPEAEVVNLSGDFNLSMEKGIDYGYAITVHKSQGITIENAFFDATGLPTGDKDLPVVTSKGEQITTEAQSLAYVAMSRASKKLTVFADKPGMFVELKDLKETKPKPSESNKEEVKPSITQTNENNKPLGSTSNAKDLLTDVSTAKEHIVMEASNTLDTFDKLDNIKDNKSKDTSEHSTYLRNEVKNLIAPLMEKVSLYLFDTAEYSYGHISSDMKQVAINIGNDIKAKYDGLRMSTQEIFVHELKHAITALAYSEEKNYRIANLINLEYEKVSRALHRAAKSSDTAISDKAKDYLEKFNHVFDNKTLIKYAVKDITTGKFTYKEGTAGVHEYMAFGGSNREFMDMLEWLPKQNKLKLNQVADDSEQGYKEASWLETIGNLFNKIVETYLRKTKGTHALDPLVRLDELTRLLATAHTNKPAYDVKFVNDKVNAIAVKKIHDWIKEPTHKILMSNMVQKSIVKDYATLLDFALKNDSFTVSNLVRQTLRQVGVSHKSLLPTVMGEILGSTKETSLFHKLITKAGHTEQTRNNKIVDVIEELTSSFGKLSDKTHESITKGFFRTDISSLIASYSLSKAQTYLTDKNVRDTEIKALERVLQKDIDGSWLIRETRSLAKFMVHNSFDEGTGSANTYLIATKALKDGKGNAEILEPIILKLSRLYALNETNQEHLNEVAQMFKDKPEAMNKLIKLHSDTKANILLHNFKGDKSIVRDGSIKELYSINRELSLNTTSELRNLREQKYSNEGQLKRVSGDTRTNKGYFHLIKVQTLMPWMKTGVSFSDPRKGITQYSTGYSESENYKIEDNREKASLGKDLLKQLKATPYAINKNNTSLAPIFKQGNVIGYTYILNNETKDKLLESKFDSFKAIASESASINYNEDSFNINKEIVDAIKEDWKTYGYKLKEEFVKISSDSTDPEYVALWNRLPEDMKKYIGTDGMYVRGELVNLVFGYRKISITDWIRPQEDTTKKKMVGNYIYDAANALGIDAFKMKSWEIMWQEAMSVARESIVVKSVVVTLGNEASNAWHLRILGVPLAFELIEKGKAMRQEFKWRRDHSELQEHLAKESMDANYVTPEIRAKMLHLVSVIAHNPMNKFHDLGIAQTLAEDLNKEKSQTLLAEKFKPLIKQWEKTPDWLKTVGNNIALTQETKGYQLLNELAQMSDLTSRAVLYAWRRTQAESTPEGFTEAKQDLAIEEVKEDFVQYAPPTHPTIQYGNDMGFFMFSKFFFRVLPVVAKTIGKYPARVLGLQLLEEFIGETSSMYNSLNPNKFINPWDTLTSIIGTNPLFVGLFVDPAQVFIDANT